MASGGWEELTIGKKIHLYRINSDMNIEKLAKLSGISQSYISKVECDKSIPSIDVLESLSWALKTTASQLLANPPFYSVSGTSDDYNPKKKQKLMPTIVRKDERKKIRPAKARIDYELLTPDLQRELEFVMVVHPPRQKTEPTSHIGEESMLCLSGSISVVIDEETYFLSDGDALSFDCSVPHYVINDSEKPTTLIIVSTPANF